jgi:hypothetical protein
MLTVVHAIALHHRQVHFDVGILRPNWLDGATYLGQHTVDNITVNTWTKVQAFRAWYGHMSYIVWVPSFQPSFGLVAAMTGRIQHLLCATVAVPCRQISLTCM